MARSEEIGIRKGGTTGWKRVATGQRLYFCGGNGTRGWLFVRSELTRHPRIDPVPNLSSEELPVATISLTKLTPKSLLSGLVLLFGQTTPIQS